MYTVLWWKDARQFWPIWVFLALAAVIAQGLFLHYLGEDARHGTLGILALVCASLYAFATGAAAFAGEREMGTLRLLDVLPADRRVVWSAKVSFALLTTLALALILLVVAALYSDQWKPQGPLATSEALGFAMLVLLALGWGLFWSAIWSNALTAAVMAVFSTGISLGLLMSRLDNVFHHHVDLSTFVLSQFLVFLTTLLASVVIFTWSWYWKRLPLTFQSPVIVNLPNAKSPRLVPLQVESPVPTVLARRFVVATGGAWAANQSPHRSWLAEGRALAWQTAKEGRRTWSLLVAIGLVIPALVFLWSWGSRPTPEWFVLIMVGISLVAGVNVFGLENRARTQRFLTHHAARPGLVWLVKLGVWSLGLVACLGPLALLAKLVIDHNVMTVTADRLAYLIMIALYFGAVGLLSGMVIRRGITALVVAFVIAFALIIPVLALVEVNVLPLPGLLAIPVGLLGVSWAWSGDWLLDRPAPGRWIRLSLLLAGMFALAISGYGGYRAWSIRDVGLITPPAAWGELTTSALPTDQNAAELYREAGRRLVGPVADRDSASPEFLNRNRDLLPLLRRAAAQRNCRFLEPQKLTVLDQLDGPPINQLAHLLVLGIHERQSQGDLAGAWDDIMVLFQMAHHLGTGSGYVLAFPNAMMVEREALGCALEWAVARGQTPERLHAALATYRKLPPPAATADMVRAEANVVEQTLNLPISRLRDWFFNLERSRKQGVFEYFLFDLATMPWERVRARRVNRLMANAALQETMHEPWERSAVRNPEIEHAETTTRSAMMLIRHLAGYVTGFDQTEVGRRAFVQVVALRAWQLDHGGQFPKTLDVLIPTELASLPLDPFSGRPFCYLPSHGERLPPLHLALTPSAFKSITPTPGSWLLYSVGPNRQDNGGISVEIHNTLTQPLDIVFVIPPVDASAGTSKEKDQSQKPLKAAPP